MLGQLHSGVLPYPAGVVNGDPQGSVFFAGRGARFGGEVVNSKGVGTAKMVVFS